MRLRVPNRRSLEGAYHLDAELAEPEVADHLGPLIDRIALVASRGAFTSSEADVSQSRFDILDRRLSAGLMRFRLQLAAIDPRLVELVRAVASHRPDRPAPAALVLHPVDPAAPPDIREMPWPDDENPFRNYPGRARDITFRVASDSSITSRMRRAVVTFLHDVGAGDVASFADWLRPLGELVEEGAFCLPSATPSEAISIYGGVQQFEADSIEIVIDRFDANDALWDVLVNMIDAFARAGRRVSEVWLE